MLCNKLIQIYLIIRFIYIFSQCQQELEVPSLSFNIPLEELKFAFSIFGDVSLYEKLNGLIINSACQKCLS